MNTSERWIVFDYGGTLASPSPRVTSENVGQYFANLLPAQLRGAFLEKLRCTWANADNRGREIGLDVSVCSILHDVFLEIDVPFVGTQNILDSFLQQLGDGVVTASAVKAVRDAKRLGYMIGLASNTLRSSRIRRQSLRQAGIEHAFSAVVLSSEIGFRKPHPMFFEILLRRIGVPADHVIFVGDTWHKDVLAPIESGMRAVWVANSNKPDLGSAQYSTPFVNEISELSLVLAGMSTERRHAVI